MKKRDRIERLLVAVWEGWRDGRPRTKRELCIMAGYYSAGSVDWWKLENAGWITGRRTSRSIVPGPRFGGVYQGKPYRVICDDDTTEQDTRAPKYERRGVLFEYRREATVQQFPATAAAIGAT